MGRRGGRRGKVHVAEKAEPRKREKQVSRRKQLLEREKAEIEKLTQRIADEAPKRGSMNAPAKQFDDLPISAATLKGAWRAAAGGGSHWRGMGPLRGPGCGR